MNTDSEIDIDDQVFLTEGDECTCPNPRALFHQKDGIELKERERVQRVAEAYGTLSPS